MFFKKKNRASKPEERKAAVIYDNVAAGNLLLFRNELEDLYANKIIIKYGRRSLFANRLHVNHPSKLEEWRLSVVELINSETDVCKKEILKCELKATVLKVQFENIIKQSNWESSAELVKKATKLSKGLSRVYFKLAWLENDKQYDAKFFDFSTPEGNKKARSSTGYRQFGITYRGYVANAVSGSKKDAGASIRRHKQLADIYGPIGHNDLCKVNAEIGKVIAMTHNLLASTSNSEDKKKYYNKLALLYFQLSKNYRDQYHADFSKAGNLFEMAKHYAKEANLLSIADSTKKDFFAHRVNYKPYQGFMRSFRFWFNRRRLLRSIFDMYFAANEADGDFVAHKGVGCYKDYFLKILHDMNLVELRQLYLILSRDKIQNLISSVSYDVIRYTENNQTDKSMVANTVFQLLAASVDSVKEELIRRGVSTQNYDYLTPFDDLAIRPKGYKKSHRALRTTINYLDQKGLAISNIESEVELKPVI